MEVLDYFSAHDKATMEAFQTQGIGRYLTSSSQDVRQLTTQEVSDAHSLGLSIHLFYEMNPTYLAYFTFAQGAEDCRQAQARLAELGAPDGTVVYFTVDTNVGPEMIVEYFNGIESSQTPAITPGIYGYQRMCEYADKNFPAMGKHLWQTYGSRIIRLDGWQHLQENRAGVSVDVNEVTVPGWKGADMTDEQVRAIIADYLANTYGPALEAELTQRQGQAVADAVKAAGVKLSA